MSIEGSAGSGASAQVSGKTPYYLFRYPVERMKFPDGPQILERKTRIELALTQGGNLPLYR